MLCSLTFGVVMHNLGKEKTKAIPLCYETSINHSGKEVPDYIVDKGLEFKIVSLVLAEV